MTFGAIQSGQCFPDRRSASPQPGANPPHPRSGASVTSASDLRALCVSHLSLNFLFSTLDSSELHLPCFHNVPHSSTSPQISPLCFHNLTNSLFCKQPVYTHLSKHRGCTPLATILSEPVLELRPLTSSIRAACPARQTIKLRRHLLDPSASARLQCVLPHD